jgi:hypothetical protein
MDNKLANLANMDPAALSKKSKMVRRDTTYHIEMSLHYKADPGINICLFGKIPELSMWDKEDPKCWMKRTAGDIWVMEKPVVTNQFFFTYKFALFDSNRKFLNFEKGIDRIADMELLDEAPAKYSHDYYDYRNGRNLQSEPAKDVIKRTELNLGWEMFRVTFSVSYPIDDPNNQMVLMGS